MISEQEKEVSIDQHSPLPWHVTVVRDSVDDIVDANGKHVVCFGHDYEDYGFMSLYDAQFIVTAVNSYDDLLAALKEYVEWFGAVHGQDCPADDTCDCIGGGLNARVSAAIARAEGR